MFKSLHSVDLHLNWGWLCTVCKSWSTTVAVVCADFSLSDSFNKYTLLIKPYFCEKHPEAQHYIMRDGSAFENKCMKGCIPGSILLFISLITTDKRQKLDS